MFWDEETSAIEKRQKALDEEFNSLLNSLMCDYLEETKKHLSSLRAELKNAVKLDAFGNEITPEGKDEEVWEYFVQKNLWENIFNKGYKTKQAHYLNRLEDFLSETVFDPEKNIELFGRGLLWRYYAKPSSSGHFTFQYQKTDDPLVPLVATLKTFYSCLKDK